MTSTRDTPPHRRPSPRRGVIVVVGMCIVIALAIGVVQSAPGPNRRSGAAPTLRDAARRVAGAPAPIAALYQHANTLLPQSTFKRILRTLRGSPVVVDVWASFCGPCRTEAPILANAAADYGRSTAFLGLNADPSPTDATSFVTSEARTGCA
jgi:thiol-disulfide isomerase/thioredoxin